MRIVALLLILLATAAAADEVCIEAPYSDPQSAAQHELIQLYSSAMRALDGFPSLRKTVSTQSPAFCYASQMDGAYGYLEVERNRIYVTQTLSRSMQLGILLHEIRHLDQLATGACPSDNLAMKEYARATFAQEADASAIALLVAWHLKAQGDPQVWSALSSWPSQSDIASRFEEEMIATGKIDAAVAAAFDQWYASESRRSQYYLSTCSAYLDRLDARHTLPGYQVLPPDFYSDLCRLPDGNLYTCAEPDHPLR